MFTFVSMGWSGGSGQWAGTNILEWHFPKQVTIRVLPHENKLKLTAICLLSTSPRLWCKSEILVKEITHGSKYQIILLFTHRGPQLSGHGPVLIQGLLIAGHWEASGNRSPNRHITKHGRCPPPAVPLCHRARFFLPGLRLEICSGE